MCVCSVCQRWGCGIQGLGVSGLCLKCERLGPGTKQDMVSQVLMSACTQLTFTEVACGSGEVERVVLVTGKVASSIPGGYSYTVEVLPE